MTTTNYSPPQPYPENITYHGWYGMTCYCLLVILEVQMLINVDLGNGLSWSYMCRFRWCKNKNWKLVWAPDNWAASGPQTALKPHYIYKFSLWVAANLFCFQFNIYWGKYFTLLFTNEKSHSFLPSHNMLWTFIILVCSDSYLERTHKDTLQKGRLVCCLNMCTLRGVRWFCWNHEEFLNHDDLEFCLVFTILDLRENWPRYLYKLKLWHAFSLMFCFL